MHALPLFVRSRATLVILLLAACGADAALATAPTPPAAVPAIDMHHSSWTAKDGAPGYIIEMAQTRDGMLWLGSPTGLASFDGARFERFSPGADGLPSSNISTLAAAPSGGLWIGYRLGGASLWKDNVLRNYGKAQGLPTTTVWNVTEDADGRVWAGTARGLYFMESGRWRAADSSAPSGNISATLLDRRGTLWVRTLEGAWYLPRGEQVFRHFPKPLGRGGLQESLDGSVWTSEFDNPDGSLILLAGPPSGAKPDWAEGTPTGGDFIFDRHGGLWRSRDGGIEHVAAGTVGRAGAGAAAGTVQRLNQLQGYSGENAQSLLEDREGNIWTGTDKGLDRFRANKLSTLTLPKFYGEARALALDGAGGLWMNRLYLPPPYTAALGAGSVPPVNEQYITCLYTDPGGTVWSGDRGHLSRRVGERWEPLPLPPEAEGGPIFAISREPNGTLWVSVRIKGIYRWRDGQWHHDGAGADAPQGVPMVITADAGGRVWFGYAHHQISLLENGKLRSFDDDSGLRLGAVLEISAGGKHVWAGDEKGVMLYDGKRFVPLRTSEDDALIGASGIVETPDGDLWVHGALGIAHITAAELAGYFSDPQRRVRFDRYDFQDGLAGTAAQLLPRPSMVAGKDGRLWFSTSSSVQWMDPAHLARNGLPPPVMIQALVAEGQRLEPAAGIALAGGTRDLRIDYTATSLTLPERMRFAYRLDGVDRDWRAGGPQRSAYYTNLGPGDYRFRVKASNNDGVWNETGAELAFSVRPTVTQTLWFRLLCGGAGVLLLWSLYRLRLRQVARQIHARLDERIDERERIARELHDTLLQAVQGMMLHIQAALMKVPRQEPVRVMVESALRQADGILSEGRDKVRDLRAGGESGAAGDLPALLAAAAADALGEGVAATRTGDADGDGDAHPVASSVAAGIEHRLLVIGTPRGLHPIAGEEILAIAREAMANAVRHSGASLLTIELHYGVRELRLTLRDDGVGIDEAVLAAGGREGHWGLAGIRERAARIKAKLTLQSAPGAGTEWQLTLAADLAYQQAPPRTFWNRPAAR